MWLPPSHASPSALYLRRIGWSTSMRSIGWLPGWPEPRLGSRRRPISSRHDPPDRVGVRHGSLADARHQTDPRPVGRRRLGAGVGFAGAHRRAARCLSEAPEVARLMTPSARLAQIGVSLSEGVSPLAFFLSGK